MGQTPDVVGSAERGALLPPVEHRRPDRKAIGGPGNGRSDYVSPVETAVAGLGFVVGQQRAGRGDRLVANVVDVAIEDEAESVSGFADQQVLPHVGAHGSRRRAVEVDTGVDGLTRVGAWAAGRQEQLGAPESGYAAHLGIDHAGHQGAGHRRIHSVATGP